MASHEDRDQVVLQDGNVRTSEIDRGCLCEFFSPFWGRCCWVSIPPGTVVASRDFSVPSPSQGMSCKPNVVSRFSSPSVCKTRRPRLVFQVSCVGICWTILAPESRSAVWLTDIDIN